MKKPTLLILAAGMGSRYGGLKQIEPVGPSGETIMEYSVFDAIRSGFGKVVFVIRRSFDTEFRERFEPKLKGRIQTEYIHQELENLPAPFRVPEGREKPWGTGHAVSMAAGVISEPFVVINADDFYGLEAYKTMKDFFDSDMEESHFAMVGYQLSNTLSEHGHVSRGVCQRDSNHNLVEIFERTRISIDGQQIVCKNSEGMDIPLTGNELVSMNFWGFKPILFQHIEEMFKRFLNEKIGTPNAEFYIPQVVYELILRNQIRTKVLDAHASWFGITYKEDRDAVVKSIRKMVSDGLYPENLWFKE